MFDFYHWITSGFALEWYFEAKFTTIHTCQHDSPTHQAETKVKTMGLQYLNSIFKFYFYFYIQNPKTCVVNSFEKFVVHYSSKALFFWPHKMQK